MALGAETNDPEQPSAATAEQYYKQAENAINMLGDIPLNISEPLLRNLADLLDRKLGDDDDFEEDEDWEEDFDEDEEDEDEDWGDELEEPETLEG